MTEMCEFCIVCCVVWCGKKGHRSDNDESSVGTFARQLYMSDICAMSAAY